ncbi:hypothetical protein OESDEN_11513 [Oesophagostomum dentatum]|uniref:DDE Tnp4 domain-containing protein n=1 Tax=Oesophagostomum dentatum TaxID=61180 RepID=A0A0B1SYX7_OESDE|nr:hypothetical protein OESDEN_11513 [Oesophagostomum dentatum]
MRIDCRPTTPRCWGANANAFKVRHSSNAAAARGGGGIDAFNDHPDNMTFNYPSDLMNILWALELIQAMAEDIKSDERTRLYVREEHRLFLDSRFQIIRYVGHGYGYGSLAEELNIGRQTVSDIVAEVTDVINIFLFAEAFPPVTREMMEDCAVKAQDRYDYPRAAGFMDGKHVGLRKPKNSGSAYWNYKSFHSIILLAVCDCDYRFITFDVGSPGRAGDAGVFRNSFIRTFFELHDEVFPETAMLNEVGPVQYHILVDGGFAQGHRYVRPFAEPAATTASKRRFNAKHSG